MKQIIISVGREFGSGGHIVAQKFMEEPGSLDYVAEGESMRIFGLLGCILYTMVFVPILFFLYKRKHYLYSFLVSMLLGGIIPGIYIFVLR